MSKKTKKVYESPSMKVYEIGRSQILAGSEYPTTKEGYSEDEGVLW